jgi:predicted transcriptional regulator
VKIYQNDLKYFGELRNHISHGLKVDEYIYAIPTQKAIDKLADFVDKIVSPPLCIDFFRKKVHSVQYEDSLKDLLSAMKTYGYTHVPVYSASKKFLGVVTES